MHMVVETWSCVGFRTLRKAVCLSVAIFHRAWLCGCWTAESGSIWNDEVGEVEVSTLSHVLRLDSWKDI